MRTRREKRRIRGRKGKKKRETQFRFVPNRYQRIWIRMAIFPGVRSSVARNKRRHCKALQSSETKHAWLQWNGETDCSARELSVPAPTRWIETRRFELRNSTPRHARDCDSISSSAISEHSQERHCRAESRSQTMHPLSRRASDGQIPTCIAFTRGILQHCHTQMRNILSCQRALFHPRARRDTTLSRHRFGRKSRPPAARQFFTSTEIPADLTTFHRSRYIDLHRRCIETTRTADPSFAPAVLPNSASAIELPN